MSNTQNQAQTKAVSKRGTTQATLRAIVERPDFQAQLRKLVPNPQRFARVVINQLLRVPSLAECTQASFVNSLLQAAQIGIEPDGRNAHLIPYRSKAGTICTLILDYKGLVHIALRGGKYTRIYADVVCDGDEFEFDRGVVTKHKINIHERGSIIGAYAFAVDKDNQQVAVYLNRKEIEGIRARSRAASSGPWVTDYAEMCKKTAVRRLSKWLLLEPEAEEAIQQDAENEFGGVEVEITKAEVLETPATELESVAEEAAAAAPSPVEVEPAAPRENVERQQARPADKPRTAKSDESDELFE